MLLFRVRGNSVFRFFSGWVVEDESAKAHQEVLQEDQVVIAHQEVFQDSQGVMYTRATVEGSGEIVSQKFDGKLSSKHAGCRKHNTANAHDASTKPSCSQSRLLFHFHF